MIFEAKHVKSVLSYLIIALIFCFILVLEPGKALAAHFGYREIHKASQGEDVANLQWLLGKMGFYSDDITGEYDDTTEEAVVLLQVAFDLEGNGSVSGETLDLLIQAWAAYQFTEFGYKVKKGDTLSHIAKVWGVPLDVIVKLNEIKNPDLIIEGQYIHIPVHEFSIYMVEEGDSPESIAQKYGVKIEHLLEWNGLKSIDEITANFTLIILDIQTQK